MKNYAFILFILICLSIMNCKTVATSSKQSNAEEQRKRPCEDMVWYSFINGKPDRYYLESSKKVAERWGFKIVYDLGSCTNSEEDKKRDSISQEKSILLFTCLTKNVGENWETKFRQEVKTELKQ